MVGLYQRTIIVARYGGKIHIGCGCGISGSTIYAMDNISIGNNVLIGGNCKIIDNDFHPLQDDKRHPQRHEDIKKKPILIGDGCFIGANSIILKGTTIGKNCVIGAGSVVHGAFPDNVIIAGNPAKIIKENK
ncbi:MAG: acyltransferase [Bacteroidales bacterium]|nr:acyltransferase [Bacteroidales bacterium]